jgi:hypothetical protein
MVDNTQNLEKYTDDSPVSYILDELGFVFFEKLQAKFGGCDLKLPRPSRRLKANHWLVKALGQEDAEVLQALGPFETFYVPLLVTIAPKLEKVAEGVKAGMTVKQIARKIVVSERHVRRLKKQSAEVEAAM